MRLERVNTREGRKREREVMKTRFATSLDDYFDSSKRYDRISNDFFLQHGGLYDDKM